MITKPYYYVILRLRSNDRIRGEVLNAGFVLFHQKSPPKLFTYFSKRLQSIRSELDFAKFEDWSKNIETIVNSQSGMKEQIRALEMFDFCEKDCVGLFHAENDTELEKCIFRIEETFIKNPV